MKYLIKSGIKFDDSHDTSILGFSLVEVLVAVVIITVSSIAALSAFGLVTQTISGTGLRADQSRRIDSQIAQIIDFSNRYTSCLVPSGSVETSCGGGISPKTSFYYFPDPTNSDGSVNVQLFFDSCRNAVPDLHITHNFILAINALVSPGGGVSEPLAVRVNPVASNSLVRITWRSDPGGRLLREMQLSPVVSSWCP